MIQKLEFFYNWNGKLNCSSFTTIRMKNEQKYYIGAVMNVYLAKQIFGMYQVVGVKTIKLQDISNWIALLDTGYDAEKCKNIITEMYKNKGVDWETQELHYVLLKKM